MLKSFDPFNNLGFRIFYEHIFINFSWHIIIVQGKIQIFIFQRHLVLFLLELLIDKA